MNRISRRAIIPQEMAGMRLDQVAAEILDEFSRTRLKGWIESGSLTVDGSQSEPALRVKGGEALNLAAPLDPAVPVEPEHIPIQIMFEDEHLLIVNKQAGLVVHPGAGNPTGTLQNALLHHDAGLATLPRAGLVHRLDKDTSGLLVVARQSSAQQALIAQIERRDVSRIYHAVCQTVLTGGGVIDAPLGRHARDRKRMTVRSDGRSARTQYRLLDRFRAHSYVELKLESGRTHQIRVHMAHIRAPLVGDPVYGGRPRFPKQPMPALERQLKSFPRQALHAVKLGFVHPASGEAMEFVSSLPADLNALLEALAKDRAEAAH